MKVNALFPRGNKARWLEGGYVRADHKVLYPGQRLKGMVDDSPR